MDLNLGGKVAIVTGAGSGIGKAIAQTLAKEGVKVVANDINEQTAKQTVEEIRSSGGQALAIKADVSSLEEVAEMAKKATQEWGRIDILVNNAAYIGLITAGAPPYFVDEAEKDTDAEINVTFKGTLNCCKVVIPSMTEQKYGRIISITSDASKVSSPRQAVYSGVKAGIAGFSRALAGELARHNITVNCVSPGTVATPAALTEATRPIVEKMIAGIPIRRQAQMEEVANIVAYLASDLGSYVTGQNWSVSGGMTMSH